MASVTDWWNVDGHAVDIDVLNPSERRLRLEAITNLEAENHWIPQGAELEEWKREIRFVKSLPEGELLQEDAAIPGVSPMGEWPMAQGVESDKFSIRSYLRHSPRSPPFNPEDAIQEEIERILAQDPAENTMSYSSVPLPFSSFSRVGEEFLQIAQDVFRARRQMGHVRRPRHALQRIKDRIANSATWSRAEWMQMYPAILCMDEILRIHSEMP